MVALPPLLSVPVAGGPTVPVTIVKDVEGKLPLLSVVTSADKGLEQETDIGLPKKAIVGWLGSLLHSRIDPVDLAVKPDPETVMTCPLLRLVSGMTLKAPDAQITAGVTKQTTIKAVIKYLGIVCLTTVCFAIVKLLEL